MQEQQGKTVKEQKAEQSKKEFLKEAERFAKKMIEKKGNDGKPGEPKNPNNKPSSPKVEKPTSNPAVPNANPSALTANTPTGIPNAPTGVPGIPTTSVVTGNATAGSTAGAGAAAGSTAAAGATAGGAATAGAAAGGAAAGATAAGTAATVGAAAGAGAATGGIGAAIILGLAALKAIKDKADAEIESLHYAGNPEKEMGIGVKIMLFIGFFVFVVFFTILSPVISFIAGIVEVAEDTATFFGGLFPTEKERFFADVFPDIEDPEEIDRLIEEPRKLDAANIRICKEIIDYAISEAFCTHAFYYAWNPEHYMTVDTENFNFHETYEQFLNQPYPYTLRKNDNKDSYYTIREYLDGDIPEEEINNDLNYAEIISVIFQSEDYTMENFTYSTLYDLLVSDRTSSLFFELEYGEKYFGCYTNNGKFLKEDDARDYLHDLEIITVELKEDGESTDVFVSDEDKNNIDFPNGFFYYEVKVTAYGIDELYQIAKENPFAPYLHNDTKMNYEMIDINEKWLRETMPKNINLGPAYYEERSTRSVMYDRLAEYTEPTGRSMYSYLENSVVGERMEPVWRDDSHILNKIAYSPTGESVILKMPSYINQGSSNYSYIELGNTTIGKAGCFVCCCAMITNYFEQSGTIVENNVALIKYIEKNFVNRNGTLDAKPFVEERGYKYMSQTDLMEKYPDSSQTEIIVNVITEGCPAIIYIKGQWIYGNLNYHDTENTHFLLAVGYDKEGIYVYDPGSKRNTINGAIPYDAFAVAPELNVRAVMNGPATYEINTISQN